MVKKILLLALPVIVLSCGQRVDKKTMSEYEAEVFQETLDKVKALEGRLADMTKASPDEVDGYLREVEGLRYRNDTSGMGESAKESCAKLERRVDILKRDAVAACERRLKCRCPSAPEDSCPEDESRRFPDNSQ